MCGGHAHFVLLCICTKDDIAKINIGNLQILCCQKPPKFLFQIVEMELNFFRAWFSGNYISLISVIVGNYISLISIIEK